MSKMKPIDIPNVRLLIPSNINLPFNSVIKIPSYETETQNYINMCDLVVSKTGYSTISEAIKGKVPMFLLKRQGFKEDEILGNTIEQLGIGRFISEKAFLDGEWKYELGDLDKYIAKYDDLNDLYIKDGTMEIIDIIKKVAS
jgi:UDP-N-acetylglucosamine:LPS N-acetylglucosamine transferase